MQPRAWAANGRPRQETFSHGRAAYGACLFGSEAQEHGWAGGRRA